MPIEPTNTSAALAGAMSAQQTHARIPPKKEALKARKPTTPRDMVDISVNGVETEEAIRDLKDASQEESREDRQAHGDDVPPEIPKHLDLEA